MIEPARRLVDQIARLGPVTVAFSGGVDSSVVLAAAVTAGCPVVAVTAISPAVATWQQATATRIAAHLGVRHRLIATQELDNDRYVANGRDRCFHCKSTLYAALQTVADHAEGAAVLSGTNADDLGDTRPGLAAGRAAGVLTPLADLGLSKADVRAMAREFGLPNAELPASPCLASRIAYGVPVTAARLGQIDAVEGWLRDRGLDPVRVRVMTPTRICIEVADNQRDRLNQLQKPLADVIAAAGWSDWSIDPAGFRSGRLNELPVVAS